jgi:hypothetical protein
MDSETQSGLYNPFMGVGMCPVTPCRSRIITDVYAIEEPPKTYARERHLGILGNSGFLAFKESHSSTRRLVIKTPLRKVPSPLSSWCQWRRDLSCRALRHMGNGREERMLCQHFKRTQRNCGSTPHCIGFSSHLSGECQTPKPSPVLQQRG